MNVDRTGFAKSLTGVVGALAAGPKVTAAAPTPAPASLARAQPGLLRRWSRGSASCTRPTTTRTARRPSPKAIWSSSWTPTSVLRASARRGSPDTVRNVARSVIGKNVFDTETIWQAAFMDGFYVSW